MLFFLLCKNAFPRDLMKNHHLLKLIFIILCQLTTDCPPFSKYKKKGFKFNRSFFWFFAWAKK